MGMGSQDLWFGEPILPEELAALPYKQRKDRVISAINSVGPPKADEVPFTGDAFLSGRVTERVARTGVDEPHAVLMEILAERHDPHPDTARIVEGDRTGVLRLGTDANEAWLGELAERLYGPRGSRIDR